VIEPTNLERSVMAHVRDIVFAFLGGGLLLLIGCAPPKLATVDWYADPSCEGCDRAVRLAVDHLQVKDVQDAQRWGVPLERVRAVLRESGTDYTRAVPDRVCPEPDELVVMFVMPGSGLLQASYCFNVYVKPDGSTADGDKEPICRAWRERKECPPIRWRPRAVGQRQD
jgi:hypothetical protein